MTYVIDSSFSPLIDTNTPCTSYQKSINRGERWPPDGKDGEFDVLFSK
jgi:hypothetical protein